MGYREMFEVRASGLTDRTQVDVLEALAFFKNAKTGKCFPSTEALARVSRVNPNLVRKTIRDLVKAGLVSYVQEPGRPRYFTLNLSKLPEGVDVSEPPEDREGVPLEESKGVEETTPLEDCKGDPLRKVKGTPLVSSSTPLEVPKAEQGREQGREQGSFSPAFACDAPADGVAHKTGVTPSPDDWASLLAEPAPVEDDYPADLFSDVDPATAKVPAPKPRTNARTSSSSTSSRAKPKRLCPFDLDAVIPDDWRDAFAADYPTLDLAAEFRKFVGWHVAKGNTYADWKAAFRNWLGNAVKFQARDRNYSKDNRHDVQASRQGSILTPQSEYDYAEGLRIFEARRAARRARDA